MADEIYVDPSLTNAASIMVNGQCYQLVGGSDHEPDPNISASGGDGSGGVSSFASCEDCLNSASSSASSSSHGSSEAISRPGYAIYPRSCCSGEINNSIFLDLTSPPTIAFTGTFKLTTSIGYPGECFFFDLGDVYSENAVPINDVAPGSTSFLINQGDYTNLGTCDTGECGCKCCNDWRQDPDDPLVGTRSGSASTSSYWGGGPIWYQFTGVEICPRVFECNGSGGLWWRVQHFDLPTGPYTGDYTGSSERDYGCADALIPNISYTVKFYSDDSCSTPHSSRPDETHRLLVWPGVISMGTSWSIPDPTCGSIDAAKIFWGGNDDGSDNTSNCFDDVEWENQFVGCECSDNPSVIGFGQGYGGTCFVGVCCPDGGGV